MKRLMLNHFCILTALCIFFYTLPAAAVSYTEDFEFGYTDGSAIRLHADWFTESSRTNPTTEDNVGVGGTWGLSNGSPIFTWEAHPFDWNTDLAVSDKVIFQMDFQTDGSGHFDDDRIGWMISNTDDSSSHIFGIQLDPGGSGYCIEGYWDGVSADDRRPHIVDLPALSASSWYRFKGEITKLTATSAQIDVSLTQLDGSGNPVSVVANGGIADTSTLGSDAPNSKYFTGPIWPGYKNYSAISGAADNAYFEIVTGAPNPVISGYILEPNDSPIAGVAVDANNGGGSDTTDLNGLYEISTPNDWSGVITPTISGYTFEPESRSYLNVTSDISDQNFVGTKQTVPSNWTAYNDCVYDATQHGVATNPNGQLVHYKGANVTIYNIGSGSPGPSSGELMDYATGIGTGITATLTQSGGVIWQPDTSSNWYGGYDTAVGTDARNTFGDIADMTGVTYYGSSGWYVDLVLTGLDSSKKYIFATSAARCKASYTNRYTIYSISGADSVINESTLGVNITSDTEVWFNTGDNYNEGYVARWTNIEPGPDGSVTIRATHHASAESGRKAYAFDVFMLQEMTDPKKAGNPDPKHEETGVAVDKILSWSAGIEAAYHDVYFGTDFNDVNDANTVITYGVYEGSRAFDVNYFDPCGLEYSQSYYWRIDEVNDSNVWRGGVWKFTTIIPECNGPLPGDFDGDCIVDTNDLRILCDEWLSISEINMLPPEEQDFHFTVTADMRSSHTAFSNLCQAINDLVGGPGEFHVSIGDVDGTVQQNRDVIDNKFGSSALWYPIIGNHEMDGGSGPDIEWLRNEYDNGNGVRIALKNYTNQDGPTGTVRLNYSWDYGNVHFVALNEYWNGGTNEGSGQSLSGDDTGTDGDIVPQLYNWLAADLAATDKPFVFVFGHEPAFPYNRHVGDSLDQYPANRDAFWNLLESEGVIAYMCGHTHYYSKHQGDASHVGEVWQLDVGNGGNDPGDGKTFFDVIVNSHAVIVNVYRDGGTGTYSLADTVVVEIDEFTESGIYNEDFETFTVGQTVGSDVDWFDGGTGPVITDGNGVADSVGLAKASAVFNWTAHPFEWADLPVAGKVVFGMDFQTDGGGQFDDDRCAWTIDSASTDSANLFGVQLDHPDGGIVTYWRDSGGTRIQDQIVDLTGTKSDTWYRLRSEVSKLSASSARLDVSLVELDANGDPVGTPYTGAVEDTSQWPGGGSPDPNYFSAASMCPAYKNFNNKDGFADNAYFEIAALVTYDPPLDSDATGDGKINFKDFAYMALNWLECNLIPCPHQ